jgi:hypothetical protein
LDPNPTAPLDEVQHDDRSSSASIGDAPDNLVNDPSSSSPDAAKPPWKMKPFSRIQSMAKAGDFPKRLATCRIPECPMCRFGKATKVPWRTKGKQNNNIKIIPVTAPGQCVSVDQLESTTPGLIAQLKGTPTKLRYRYVTVFVDHYSGLSFVYK